MKGQPVDLSELDDEALDAELSRRTAALKAAREDYAEHHDDEHGRVLWAARIAAGDAQAEQNKRHGAPPTQTISQ